MNPLFARIITTCIRIICYAVIPLAIFMMLTVRPGPYGNLPWFSVIGSALGGIALTIIAECLLDLVEIARESARRSGDSAAR